MKSLVYKNTLCFVDLYYNDIHSLTKCLALHVDKEFLVIDENKSFYGRRESNDNIPY